MGLFSRVARSITQSPARKVEVRLQPEEIDRLRKECVECQIQYRQLMKSADHELEILASELEYAAMDHDRLRVRETKEELVFARQEYGEALEYFGQAIAEVKRRYDAAEEKLARHYSIKPRTITGEVKE
jgi:tetratricopeptide (TPR) repeat protein